MYKYTVGASLKQRVHTNTVALYLTTDQWRKTPNEDQCTTNVYSPPSSVVSLSVNHLISATPAHSVITFDQFVSNMSVVVILLVDKSADRHEEAFAALLIV